MAEEGFVLLKNEANALPLERGAKISVFSKNSVNLSYGGSGSGGFDTGSGSGGFDTGSGSGGFDTSKNQDLYSSLENAGFSTNPTLKAFYEGSQSGSARSAQLQRSGQRQQPAHRHS